MTVAYRSLLQGSDGAWTPCDCRHDHATEEQAWRCALARVERQDAAVVIYSTPPAYDGLIRVQGTGYYTRGGFHEATAEQYRGILGRQAVAR